jgi:uncharacterized membrane protein
MNNIFLLAIIGVSAVFIAMQVVNGQNNESETAKTKVDKLIEDTKRENTTNELYRAELIQRMQNTTCLNTNLEGIGSVPLNTDILKTSELEGILKTCVKAGLIK